MARPTKTKIDYFPIDCTDDSRMKLVELKHGLVAYAVYVKLLQKIYGGMGYYMNWNEDIMLLFAGEYNLPLVDVTEIVEDMLKRGIFNKELHESYGILTSAEIQEQYLFVIAKRKNKELNECFCLVNSAKTPVNSVDNTHSIVEDSIVKDTIGKESIENKTDMAAPTPSLSKKKFGEFHNVELTGEEYSSLTNEYPDIKARIDRLSTYLAMSGKEYKSHYAIIKKWALEDKPQKQNNSSYDIDEFFELAVKRSQEKMLNGTLLDD